METNPSANPNETSNSQQAYNNQNPYAMPEEPFMQRHKHFFKGCMISILILTLLIPTFFIGNLIDERQIRNTEVKQEIAKQHSTDQTIYGPILVIPYMERYKDTKGKETITRANAYFMPDKLNIDTKLKADIKKRSIFKVPVYDANLHLQGSFKPINSSALSIPAENLLYNEAKLVVGITDLKGLQQQTDLVWNKTTLPMQIGNSLGVHASGNEFDFAVEAVESDNTTREALVVNIPLDANAALQQNSFDINLELKGTEKIFFTPLGTSTIVNLNSDWKDRDFMGNFIPDSSKITANGFEALWEIYRSVTPQQKGALTQLNKSTFGVNLIQPLDNYAKTQRTIKYAILVIMLTFVIYFFIEVLQKKSVHAIQYILIGFALCIFYTLLLSISEYLPFTNSYCIAAIATILLISLYTKSVFASIKTASIFGGFLTMLYAFIFILIQLQDGALLAGSIGLFIILASIMYFSRKIEWVKEKR